MKRLLTFLIPLTFFLFSENLLADMGIFVIKNYSLAQNLEIWKDVKADQLPSKLIENQFIQSPTNSYSDLFPKNFLQSNRFVVCINDCNAEGPGLKSKINQDQFKNDWDQLEATNVYYWVGAYFNFLNKKFNFTPSKFLKIVTDREIKQNEDSTLFNNAFYDPKESSLSFLPAKRNFLYSFFLGKINRSGFDPSVIIHEASHYFFEHLYPIYFNQEIHGLNEGFADFMANIFLNNTKIGSVMLRGKGLRDSSSFKDRDGKYKIYLPSLEEHSQGERISLALWKSREFTSDKDSFDEFVIDSIIDLSKNPFSTLHDFKEKMLSRLELFLSKEEYLLALEVWEIVIPGKSRDLNILTSNDFKNNSFFGFQVNINKPNSNISKTFNFNLFETKNISKQIRENRIELIEDNESNSYVLSSDIERNNILAISNENNIPIKNKNEILKLKEIFSYIQPDFTFLPDFFEKIKLFSDLFMQRGEIKYIFKIKNRTLRSLNFDFNNKTIQVEKHTITLGKRILGRLTPNLPDLESVSLITTNHVHLPQDWITLDGQNILGYEIQLKDQSKIYMAIERKNEI